MFGYVENNKRTLQVILVIAILPFLFFGLDSYQTGSSGGVVAIVGDSKIYQQEFDNSLRQRQEQLRQALGENFDPAMMNSPEMQQAILDELIKQRLLMAQARAAGYAASDREVAQVIQSVEAFQENGSFDNERYTETLSRENLNPLTFEARLRGDLVRQQVRDTYLQSGFSSKEVVEKIIRLNEQQRSISVLSISFQAFLEKTKVENIEVDEYYEKHAQEFQIPEQVKVAYVIFSEDDLLAQVDISTEAVRAYYDGRLDEFGVSEERQAAHILIAAVTTDSQADQDAAKLKADELLQQLKQNPEKFSALAQKHSQDPGSADSGGDLGFFARGMMVQVFEDVAFSLNKDEISDVVKSDFGYHIIKLLAIKESEVLPFDEVREGIFNQLRKQEANNKFAEMADQFSNAAYEQSDVLEPAAELVGAKVQQSNWLTQGALAGGIWTEKLMNAVFSDDVIHNERNTDAIEVDVNTLVVARMSEHKPSGKRELTEVRTKIQQNLKRQQAKRLAVEEGELKLAQLNEGKNNDLKWGAIQNITRAAHGSLDTGLVRKTYRVDAGLLPQYVGAETLTGYAVVRVDSITDGVVDDVKRASYVQQLRQLSGEEILSAYLAEAENKVDIERYLLTQDNAVQP
jgi:peptidyl-prolyl cis-trans isomerase D